MSAVEEYTYAHRDTGALKLRILRPIGETHRQTAVLHLHGGGWRSGAPAMLDPRSRALSALGYTVIQVQYRLLDDVVAWPAPVTDLRSAVRWVVGHAVELGVRPSAIALWGHSAGAHICLMTACTVASGDLDHPDDDQSIAVSIAAVIDCYGPTSFHSGAIPLIAAGPDGPDFAAIAANQREDGALPGIDLLAEPCNEDQADALSPLTQLTADFPPTMIVHGTHDTLIRPENSRRLTDALSSLGVVSELVTFAECGHEFDAAPSYAAVLAAHVDLFLRRVLRDPDLTNEIYEHSMF
ncbi:alpha/beta hydrolase [Mycobacterium sp. 236(2023)]|uniref:alpha/beta hydrolase n=1 Tax=Mycobacterium sp. 236(2023) TaxID=3038163 RepID=UPI002414F07E|nr:alpha/beta hydrolase [Mycobacterium sp. 236(2023)]MDG4668123.1 alpha/beta hydrolase [Mycobacterium sp. 236(2023)]